MISEWKEKLKKDIVINRKAYAADVIRYIKQHQKIFVFGAGEHGKNWTSILTEYGVKVDGICDNNQALWGKKVCGDVSCYSPQELKEIAPGIIIIAVRRYQEIYGQLQGMGFSNIWVASTNTIGFKLNYAFAKNDVWVNRLVNEVLEVMCLCEDDLSRQICYETIYQWFVDEGSKITDCGKPYFISELEKNKNEKLVDGGAYVGDTIADFLECYGNDFSGIYAFEMDSANFQALREMTGTLAPDIREKIHLIHKGLWNERKTLHYSSNCQTSKISDEGDLVTTVTPLDEELKGEEVTFIKMDIEGAELKALEGCQNHILKHKPKLAISIYHSAEDFYSIPKYIKELNPQYKILIRHHSQDESDTVCYAY